MNKNNFCVFRFSKSLVEDDEWEMDGDGVIAFVGMEGVKDTGSIL